MLHNIDYALRINDDDDDPDTERSATVALNVSVVISCYTKIYKKQKAKQLLGI
jgi:hypothetical protein